MVCASSVACSGDLLQAAVILACTEKVTHVVSGGSWCYTRESVQELSRIASRLDADYASSAASSHVNSAFLAAVESSLEPSSSLFTKSEIQVMKAVLSAAGERISLPMSAALIRQLHVSTAKRRIPLDVRRTSNMFSILPQCYSPAKYGCIII